MQKIKSGSFIIISYFAFLFISHLSIRRTIGVPLPQPPASVPAGPQLQPAVQANSTSSQQPAQPNPANLPVQSGLVQSQPTSTNPNPSGGGGAKKSPGIFNSWLCGAGYVYNQTTKMCLAHKDFSKDPIFPNSMSQLTTGGSNQTNSANVGQGSTETAEYVQLEDENISSFFPLECGMNYRYLKGAKICKPKNAPLSSESDENQLTHSSEE